MILAAKDFSIVGKIIDHPWPGCQVSPWGKQGPEITLMSNGIASMILVAVILVAVILPLARRYKAVPSGGRNVLEVLVIFVRDMIARPALHDRTYAFMPFLLTLFVFILGMNLLGMVPLENITEVIGHYFPSLEGFNIGGTPTSILTVCMGLAAIALVVVLTMSLREQAIRCRHHRGWPMALCVILSPILWILNLSPKMTGIIGVIMFIPMTFVEFVGVFSRCAALMIRLFANMISGHTLLAVMLMMIAQASVEYMKSGAAHVFFVGPICVLASVAICLLELLVALIQAYVFTFLTAIFIGLAVEEAH